MASRLSSLCHSSLRYFFSSLHEFELNPPSPAPCNSTLALPAANFLRAPTSGEGILWLIHALFFVCWEREPLPLRRGLFFIWDKQQEQIEFLAG